MAGIKHIIECHCTLKIYQGEENHLYHKFPVYSKFDSKGFVVEKIVACNNCGTLHRITDICKSEILPGGKDTNKSQVDIEDIELQIPEKISKILKKYECDVSTWEHVLDLYDDESWGSVVVLTRELIDQKYHVKILHIINDDKIKISTKVIEDEIS